MLDGRGGANPELADKNRKLRESLTGPSPNHAPVRLREFSSVAEAEAYALRDNNDFGENDDEALGAILRDLSAGGTDVDGLGFDGDELSKLFGDEDPDEGQGAGDDSGKLKDAWLVIVECTDEHPVLSASNGFVRAWQLVPRSDRLVAWDVHANAGRWLPSPGVGVDRAQRASGGRPRASLSAHSWSSAECGTSRSPTATSEAAGIAATFFSTAPCGNRQPDPFLSGGTSTTSTGTP